MKNAVLILVFAVVGLVCGAVCSAQETPTIYDHLQVDGAESFYRAPEYRALRNVLERHLTRLPLAAWKSLHFEKPPYDWVVRHYGETYSSQAAMLIPMNAQMLTTSVMVGAREILVEYLRELQPEADFDPSGSGINETELALFRKSLLVNITLENMTGRGAIVDVSYARSDRKYYAGAVPDTASSASEKIAKAFFPSMRRALVENKIRVKPAICADMFK